MLPGQFDVILNSWVVAVNNRLPGRSTMQWYKPHLSRGKLQMIKVKE